jgi:hypothetical protein
VRVVQAAATGGLPQISDGGVVNAADDHTAFSPGIFRSIYGGGFAGSALAGSQPNPSALSAVISSLTLAASTRSPRCVRRTRSNYAIT